ncbi:MAG: translation elongation factor Ts, partial [Thermoanaerobaculia bacterium]|nr:translation elongation factor Ts [Thermoanaerobaculia bacterium]
ASDPEVDSAEALSAAPLDGKPVSEHLNAAIGKMGENVVVSRVERLAVDGEGRVGGYVHAGGKLAVLVGLRTKASGEGVERIAKDVAMHVAAADPTPVAADESGVPTELLERERALYRRQAEQEGKPAKIIDRIVDGKVKKFLKDVCLVEQPFVKDPDRSVRKYLEDAAAELGEGVEVSGFVRLKLGEAADS